MGEVDDQRADAFDYHLPEAAVAQVPMSPRDAARLLVVPAPGAAAEHRHVRDLPELLSPGDLLVVNDTRVRRARLRLRKRSGGAVEVLLLDGDEALVRPSRGVAPGTVLAGDGGIEVRVGEDRGEGRRAVTLLAGDPEAVGEVPLPPYLHEGIADPERYQTVFARRTASAAAPTAGLHLTAEVLARCEQRGVRVVALELVVGLDTFRPITVESVAEHPMHTEGYDVPVATLAAVAETRAAGGAVVAVGTTVVRALESAAASGRPSGRTALFIRRGHRFAAVDRLLTNFHVPRTTLLCLLDAAVGERWRDLYAEALGAGYRFLSLGDAMLVPVDRALADTRDEGA